MAIALRGRSPADRLSVAFGRALTRAAPMPRPEAASLLGLEHEFRVLVEGRSIDFGRLLHRLPIPGQRLDPADPNAYRGPWGGAITSDGREAEIAVAPVQARPGCTAELVAHARRGRSLLIGALPATARLEGYSTHLSVAVPAGLEERTARIYVRTFAPALMLMLDGPESPGLLVRPRPGRLELGGEFVDGERLRAVAAFAAGSVRVAALAARRRPFARPGLPPAVRVAATPAIDRFGWFLARETVGAGLYAAGRQASLVLERGGAVAAGEHLVTCWAIARRAIAGIVSADDLAAADRLVAGEAPLGIEIPHPDAIAFEPDASASSAMLAAELDAGPFGRAVIRRSRPGFDVTPAIVSWDFVVLRLDDDVHTAYACLPRRVLGSALEALDDGRLDALLLGYLAATDAGGGRILAARRQTAAGGLYRAIGRASDLLAPERPPLGPTGDRPGKRRRDDQQRDRPQRNTKTEAPSGAAAGAAATAAAAGTRILGLPVGAAAAVAGIVVVAIVVGAIVLGGSGGASPTPSPPPSAAPSLTAVPSATPIPSTPIGSTAAPTPVPEPTPDPSCQRESSLHSTDGAHPKQVRFINHLAITVQTIWLDYKGKRVFYRQIPAGQDYIQPTFLTHPWIVADTGGQCLLLVVTDKNLDTVQVGP